MFCSGNSVNEMANEEFEAIKASSFLITMNYAPIKIIGHMNMWSDKKVTAFLETHYRAHSKQGLFFARDKAMRSNKSPIYPMVDYWFNERQEKLKGNYTVVWLLQLLENYFPHKKVLIFGMDMKVESSRQAKWYDDHTDYDYRKRGRVNSERKLNICAGQLDRYVKNKAQFINCNLESNYQGFEKRDWKEVVEWAM